MHISPYNFPLTNSKNNNINQVLNGQHEFRCKQLKLFVYTLLLLALDILPSLVVVVILLTIAVIFRLVFHGCNTETAAALPCIM